MIFTLDISHETAIRTLGMITKGAQILAMTSFIRMIPTKRQQKEDELKPIQAFIPADLYREITRALRDDKRTKQGLIEAACRRYLDERKLK